MVVIANRTNRILKKIGIEELRNVLHNALEPRLPNIGLLDDTGIVSDTVFINTVKDRRIVTPVEDIDHFVLSGCLFQK